MQLRDKAYLLSYTTPSWPPLNRIHHGRVSTNDSCKTHLNNPIPVACNRRATTMRFYPSRFVLLAYFSQTILTCSIITCILQFEGTTRKRPQKPAATYPWLISVCSMGCGIKNQLVLLCRNLQYPETSQTVLTIHVNKKQSKWNSGK